MVRVWWSVWFLFLNVGCSGTASDAGCTAMTPCRIIGSCRPEPKRSLTPLDTFRCKNRTSLGCITLTGGSGFASAFFQVLQGVAAALALDMCFFLDESFTQLRHPSKKSFWNEYFEPFGLPVPKPDALKKMRGDQPGLHQSKWSHGRSPIVQLSFGWWPGGQGQMQELVTPLNPGGYFHSVALQETSLKESLHGQRLEADRELVRKVIRYRPSVGQAICSRFSHLGLRPDYIAITIRRGDKTLEVKHGNAVFAPISWYVQVIEHLSGAQDAPQVFVTTDDGSTVQELREFRPNWEILSVAPGNETGFFLNDFGKQSQSHMHDHMMKFFLEVHAIANARYFIGTKTTNVYRLGRIVRMDKNPNTTFMVEDFKPPPPPPP